MPQKRSGRSVTSGEFSDREAGGLVVTKTASSGAYSTTSSYTSFLIAIFSGDDFDHHVGVGERVFEVDEGLHAVERGVCLIFANPVFLGELAERPRSGRSHPVRTPLRCPAAPRRSRRARPPPAMPWPMFPAPRTVTRWTSSSCIPKGSEPSWLNVSIFQTKNEP